MDSLQPNSYLDQLNTVQRGAVEYMDGPQLVIAGAGSGKTRVLTYKILHLLAHGYEPWRILALTFTNKAAREMRERIMQLAGPEAASRLWMGTFHSIFARILRTHADRLGYSASFTIYDASDARNLVKTIIKDMGLDEKIYKPASVASEISNAKNALMSPRQYAADQDIQVVNRNMRRERMPDIYTAYCNRCRVAQAMDFDDLLYNMNVLLRDNDDLRRHYSEFFRYILVDEYQDTNFAQHRIVTQLCNDTQNVCVVGDDAQSIYSFRGANIYNILNLQRSFPKLKTFKLEQNYRSTQNIINAAGSLIAKNVEQIPKNVFSENGSGDPIEVVKCYSDYEESRLVASRITRQQSVSGDSYDEFAVLYRTNAQSRILEESLRSRNIPYRIYGGLSFYDRKEVKDALAYFRLSVNQHDDEAVRRVINFPQRGIGDTTMRKLTSAAIETGNSLWTVMQDPKAFGVAVNKGTLFKISNFVELIYRISEKAKAGATAEEVARAALQETGILALYMTDQTPETVSRRENLLELLNSAASFVHDQREAGLTDQVYMADFLAQEALRTDTDHTDDGEDDAPRVTLMTIHAAKGLEFGHVFVVGVEEDLLPSAMSRDSQQQVEEERRLLYVAITRAKKFCMLSYASSRYRNGATVYASPSRFLRDISRQYLKPVTGTEIEAGIHVAPPAVTPRFMDTAKSYGAPAKAPRGSGTSQFAAAAQQSAAAFSTHSAGALAVGTRILHNRFGQGEITDIRQDPANGASIVVNFGNGDFKTLLLRFAKFTILDN